MQSKQPKYCGAKTRNGGTCHGRAMANGRCRMHGGATPNGVASPHYKGRGFSKYLPERLKGRYEESIADPDLLNLNAEIALIDARVAELLESVDTGDLESRWQKLIAAYDDVLAAIAIEDTKAWRAANEAIGEIIKGGANDYEAWGQLNILLETRRRLVETERKRRVEMQNMITAEQAMMLLREMMTVIHETVPEVERRRTIQTRFDRLLAGGIS